MVGLFACSFPRAEAPEEAAVLPGAIHSGEFDALTLSFTDPATLVRYEIEGPYRHVQTSASGVELEGFDTEQLQPAQILLFVRDGAVWALTRIDGREFLTRVS